MTRLEQLNQRFDARQKPSTQYPMFTGITIGVVVSTSDPQQMGRLKIRCDTLGDKDTQIDHIPWCRYFSPFGGVSTSKKSGKTSTTAYGNWNIPKLGAEVAVFCIDGDVSNRGWFACGFAFQSAASMPHGAVKENGPTPMIRDARGDAIEPLSTNMTNAFQTSGNVNYEFLSRGIDRNVQAVDDSVRQLRSSIASQGDAPISKYKYTPGYQPNNVVGGADGDSQVYGWSTPGFHAISMDDADANSRIRIRSSAGHQIILDDTNERIYVSNASGANWIEMDSNGNIDIFSNRRISMHATSDINFTSDKSIRMHAKTGIHLYSGADVRINAGMNLDVTVKGTTRLKSTGNLDLESSAVVNILAGGQMRLTSGDRMNITGSQIRETGSRIDLNGPPAAIATAAAPAATLWTNRKPDHESWARTTTATPDTNTSFDPEVPYDSEDVGRKDGGETIARNPNWKR